MPHALSRVLLSVTAVVCTLVLLLMMRLIREASARAREILNGFAPCEVGLASRFFLCLALSTGAAFLSAGEIPASQEIASGLSIFSVALCSLILISCLPPVFAEITDPARAPRGWLRRAIRRIYGRCARHEVDGAWLEVVFGATLLVAPAFTVLLSSSSIRLESVLLFGALLWALRTPIVNFEHGDSHYGFFRPRREVRLVVRWACTAVDWYARYPFALATARIPSWYAVQHVAVHHTENNGLEDTQSTAPYDRASFAGFALCAQRFAISGMFPLDVVMYLVRKKRMKPLRRLCLGYATYAAFIVLLASHSPGAAALLVLIRYASLVADAASFFQEHGFVDTSAPGQVITNSLHYIANDNDHGSRGEDLHVEHHLRPGLHWTAYPAAMRDRLPQYDLAHAVGFHDGEGQLSAYYGYLWRGDFRGLARHAPVFGGNAMSAADLERLLRDRTAPVGERCRAAAPRWIAEPAQRLAALLI